jgi:hypothetical protein
MKHVGVCCVNKLILTYLGAFVGTITAYMLLVAFVSITIKGPTKHICTLQTENMCLALSNTTRTKLQY